MQIVVQLESTMVRSVLLDTDMDPPEIVDQISFRPDLTDPSGAALFQDLDSRVKGLIKKNKQNPSEISACVVMPGSLSEGKTVLCSRLNIRETCRVSDFLSKSSPEYLLINDVAASAYGHAQYSTDSELRKKWKEKTFLFVYVDEGVGSLILINAKPVSGAGFAGPLGHAIVEPKGQYFDEFRARGALETYCSRPWMSANIVNRYYTEKNKKENISDKQSDNSLFSRALSTITLDEKKTLTYDIISNGIENGNSIAISVLNEATDYLGWTLSHLIVAINPHLIVLDGEMMHSIPEFFERTVRATRRYTWADAWNSTEMVRFERVEDHAVFGAIEVQNNTHV